MEMEVVLPVAPEFNLDSGCSSPYITAPSSPQRIAPNFFYSAPASPTSISSSVPFLQQQQQHHHNHHDDDFEFNLSGHLDPPSLSADELFDSGKIRPLEPPRSTIEQESEAEKEKGARQRSRSLSPLRVSHAMDEEEENSNRGSKNKSTWALPLRKWRLRDYFHLFRSASEGRATHHHPLRDYSFRSAGSVSNRRARGPISAHELHYTLNRAASEELKKRTFLPYRRGLLGCLGFSSASNSMHHFSSS